MVLTRSNMLPLGTTAPPFRLPEPLTGRKRSLDELASGRGTVVMFLCNHCPYVKHVLDGLIDLARLYAGKGVAFVAINSNDIEKHPDDAPGRMAELALAKELPFPYLFDEDQSVAHAYRAACTPDFYVFDGGRELVYRGQMDASRPESGVPVDGADLRQALDAVLAGEPVPEPQMPSMGCNIKWKPGNEPS